MCQLMLTRIAGQVLCAFDLNQKTTQIRRSAILVWSWFYIADRAIFFNAVLNCSTVMFAFSAAFLFYICKETVSFICYSGYRKGETKCRKNYGNNAVLNCSTVMFAFSAAFLFYICKETVSFICYSGYRKGETKCRKNYGNWQFRE